MTPSRHPGAFGELVLRRAADGHHEVISNGVFLMDTRDGRSERGLVDLAVAAVAGDHLHVVVGGLGVGFSLGAALASPRVGRVTVVEVEPAVVGLVRDATGATTGADVDDPRVTVVLGDVHDVLVDGLAHPVDVLCLDVDNGPGWTLGERNDRLYDDDGLAVLRDTLAPGGALAVWSAHDDPAFVARLTRVVGPVTTHTWQVPRGAPDVVWIASPIPP